MPRNRPTTPSCRRWRTWPVPTRLFTSLAVVTEVTHLLDFSVRKQLEFLQWVELGALTIEPITPQGFPALRTLMQRYTNLPMDFADATLVLLAERLGSQKIRLVP